MVNNLTSPATAMTTVKNYLKPGKSMTFTVPLALNATSFVVVDVDPGDTAFANDVNPANNVFATAQAIVVS